MSNLINEKNTPIKNYRIIYLFLIITLLFPKAGITTSVLPVTVATVAYVLSIAANINGYLKSNLSVQIIIIYTYLIVSSFATILFNIQSFSAMNIAYMVVLLASPITFTFGKCLDVKKTNNIIAYILILIGSYSILQFILGVQETAIQGLTIAIGDDFSKKQIIRSGWIAKIPSTYTNGTLLAPSLIILISYVLEIRKKNALNYFAVIFGIISLLLSGSRSSIFSAILLIPFLCYRIITMSKKNKTLMFSLIFYAVPLFIVILLIILPSLTSEFVDQIYNAYIGFTKNDFTLSGRTIQWADFIQNIKDLDFWGSIRFIFIGLPWNVGEHLEGLPLILKLYGVIPFIVYMYFTLSIFLKFRKMLYVYIL